VPKTYGGRRGADNIVLCCKMCNMIKSARDSWRCFENSSSSAGKSIEPRIRMTVGTSRLNVPGSADYFKLRARDLANIA
jgi:hypothetical protein